MLFAGVAHPVERHLAKVEVASSSLVTRSKKKQMSFDICFFFYGAGLEIKMQLAGGKLRAPVQTLVRTVKNASLVTRSIKTDSSESVFFLFAGGSLLSSLRGLSIFHKLFFILYFRFVNS